MKTYDVEISYFVRVEATTKIHAKLKAASLLYGDLESRILPSANFKVKITKVR